MLNLVTLFLLGIIFLAGTMKANAQLCGLAKLTWYACAKDTDCMVDFDVCGHLAAYARGDIEDIRRHHKCAAPDISCVEPPKNLDPNKAKAICKNKKCELIK